MNERDKQLELALIVCKALDAFADKYPASVTPHRPDSTPQHADLQRIIEGARKALRISEPVPGAVPCDLSDCCGARAKGGEHGVYCLECYDECSIVEPAPAPAALPAPSFELFAAVVGAVQESGDE